MLFSTSLFTMGHFGVLAPNSKISLSSKVTYHYKVTKVTVISFFKSDSSTQLSLEVMMD